jgi:hypothetical protein
MTSKKRWRRVGFAVGALVVAYIAFVLGDRWMRSVQEARYLEVAGEQFETIGAFLNAVTQDGMTPEQYLAATSVLERRSSVSWHAPWNRLVHRRRIDLPWTTLDPVVDAEFIGGKLERVDDSGYIASETDIIDADSAARLMSPSR